MLLDNGYDCVKPVVQCDAVPQWGTASIVDGIVTVQKLEKATFGQARSLNLTLKPEKIGSGRKRSLPKSGLVTKPVKVHRFGTIRRFGASHQVSTILGKRGFRDFPNVVFYSTKYRRLMRQKKLHEGSL